MEVSDVHVDTDLSAYIDGELAPIDRARVEAHLDGCDRCRARLGELRATASLISALPSARPSRSLVPVIRERFNWLRPTRSLSAFASGAFLFVFLVTAVARSGSGLGGGTTGTTAFGPAAAPAASAAPEAAAGRAFSPPPQLAAPTQLPAPAAAPQADAARGAASVSPPAGFALQATAAPTTAPKAVEQATPTTALGAARSPADAAIRATRGVDQRPSPLADPFLWLGLAVIAAVAAIAAHWRLRTT
jgi:anti-sigma factor RsiW